MDEENKAVTLLYETYKKALARFDPGTSRLLEMYCFTSLSIPMKYRLVRVF